MNQSTLLVSLPGEQNDDDDHRDGWRRMNKEDLEE